MSIYDFRFRAFYLFCQKFHEFLNDSVNDVTGLYKFEFSFCSFNDDCYIMSKDISHHKEYDFVCGCTGEVLE